VNPRPFHPRRDSHPARQPKKPPLRVLPTTLWEFPSQHYETYLPPGADTPIRSRFSTQGRADYAGATPSWVIWQLLQRYTRESDAVLDPMCGSGTTLDVCTDLNRRALAFDLSPSRPDIKPADARKLPVPDSSVDFAFIDPPYSTHIDYSDNPQDIGLLSASGEDQGAAYYDAMTRVIAELHRVLRDRRYMALYVSDSWRKKKGGEPGAGSFMPIGFDLFSIMRRHFKPIDIIAVVRHNQKLQRGNWRRAAEEGNFFLRGFNYLFIMKKEMTVKQSPARSAESAHSQNRERKGADSSRKPPSSQRR
jgi:DNA modification methylase